MTKRAAIYARVSCDKQTEARTIESQVEDLLQRVRSDGLRVPVKFRFLDDGYSGTMLMRPALEQLRDAAQCGTIDRVYIHSPDRLSRKYIHQIILIDELRRADVEVVFLNRDGGSTPEDELLLQIQGIIAEYERAKFVERVRRGRLHAARQGLVSAMGAAPYGYKYISKKKSDDAQARIELDPEEALAVEKMFHWYAVERVSLYEICSRLNAARVKTRFGKSAWNTKTISGILKNPAYTGQAAYGRLRVGPRRKTMAKTPRKAKNARREYSLYRTEPEHWIRIPVPQIVSVQLFELTQELLHENRGRKRARRQGDSHLHLLQGLVVCKLCERGFYGKGHTYWRDRNIIYSYYRCAGSDVNKCGENPRCRNRQVHAEWLDESVWSQVAIVLTNSLAALSKSSRRDRNAAKVVSRNLRNLNLRIDPQVNLEWWQQKRALIRAFVKRIEVAENFISVFYRVGEEVLLPAEFPGLRLTVPSRGTNTTMVRIDAESSVRSVD